MLQQQREKIDAIDKQLVRLFEERMRVVEEVIEIKMQNNLPILDAGREQVVLEKVDASMHSEELKPYAIEWMRELMRVSKQYQGDYLNKHATKMQ